MRKKVIIALILLLCLLCYTLCRCGYNDSQYTVICNDGTVEKMSKSELSNLYENELLYREKYEGAHVRGKGKIISIRKDSWSAKDDTIHSVSIGIDSICVEVNYVPADYASEYAVGDEFEVSGTLVSTMAGFAKIKADDFYTK